MLDEIQTIDDVAIFAAEIIREGINLHPDDDFSYYIENGTEKPFYSVEEAVLRNRLMDSCFTFCYDRGIDIYNFMLEIFLIETGLDKYVPLPSQILSE